MGFRRITLTPGRYPGGLSFAGKDSVIMQPGIYYLAGGFSFSGQAKTELRAEGVMLYSTGRVALTGQGVVRISPPTTGLYQGISVFMDRNSGGPVKITGNGSFTVSGTVYAANGAGQIAGNGDVQLGSQYITRTLDVGGNGAVNIRYNARSGPRERRIALVE
jgi:hypothetical protein